MIETQQKFSKKTIKKAVLKDSVQSPVTIYPAVLGALGAISIAAFGVTATTIGIAIGGIALAFGGWLFEYLGRHQQYSLAYLKRLHKQMQQEREQKLAQIKSELESIKAPAAINQLQLFMSKFDNFKDILERKFSPQELTYGRYLGIAEQVFLAGLDNLDSYYLAIKSVSAVDIDNLQQKIRHADEHHQSVEIDALKKRLVIYQQQLKKVEELKQQNEIALTELDHVTTKLANVQTQKGMADIDMDLAMEELSRMAHRAEKYKHS